MKADIRYMEEMVYEGIIIILITMAPSCLSEDRAHYAEMRTWFMVNFGRLNMQWLLQTEKE